MRRRVSRTFFPSPSTFLAASTAKFSSEPADKPARSQAHHLERACQVSTVVAGQTRPPSVKAAAWPDNRTLEPGWASSNGHCRLPRWTMSGCDSKAHRWP